MFEAITLEGCREVLKLLQSNQAATSWRQVSAFMFHLEESVEDLKDRASRIPQDTVAIDLDCLTKTLNDVTDAIRLIKVRVRRWWRDEDLRRSLASDLEKVLMTVETLKLTQEQMDGSDPGPAGYTKTGIEQWGLIVSEVISDEEHSDSDESTSSDRSHIFSHLKKRKFG